MHFTDMTEQPEDDILLLFLLLYIYKQRMKSKMVNPPKCYIENKFWNGVYNHLIKELEFDIEDLYNILVMNHKKMVSILQEV